jgi:hypothetical protein
MSTAIDLSNFVCPISASLTACNLETQAPDFAVAFNTSENILNRSPITTLIMTNDKSYTVFFDEQTKEPMMIDETRFVVKEE